MLDEEYKKEALRKVRDASPEHVSKTLEAIGSECLEKDAADVLAGLREYGKVCKEKIKTV